MKRLQAIQQGLREARKRATIATMSKTGPRETVRQLAIASILGKAVLRRYGLRPGQL